MSMESSRRRSSRPNRRQRQQARVEKLTTIQLNDKQRAYAGRHLDTIKNTAGFGVFLSLLDAAKTGAVSSGLSQAAAADPADASAIANRWEGYKKCAIDLENMINSLIDLKEVYAKRQKELDTEVSAQLFRGGGGGTVV